MKKSELKDRFDKADDRIMVMIKKYPVVFTLVTVVPLIVGVVLGKWAL